MFRITVLIFILVIICPSMISGAGNGNVDIALYPINAVIFEPLTIICSAPPSEIPITMNSPDIDGLTVTFKGAYNNKTCDIAGSFNVKNTYRCSNDSSIATYNTTIPGPFVKDHLNSKTVMCSHALNNSFKETTIYVHVPVTSLTITPVGINDTLKVATGQLKQIICKSNPIRPAAKIEWFIDRHNVTNQAIPSTETDAEDQTKFISTSILSYTGTNSNHRKVLYCEAVDIGGRYKIKSKEKKLFIILPIETVTINQGGIDNKVNILIGANITFTCKTGVGRPAAFIRWYIGDENVTDTALTVSSPDSTDNTTFKSTSTLIYTGNNNHHNKTIYCEASNFEGRPGIKSDILTMYITVPVPNVYFEPQNGSTEIRVAINQTKTLTCRTNACRPPAWINWFIGERNVTSLTTLTSSLDVNDNTKYISTSTFRYTGNDSDHGNVIRCVAVNMMGEDNVRTADKLVFIMVSISTVTLTTDTASDVVYIKYNRTHTFTCKTSEGRPTAWIKWYIGNENVTYQATVGTIEVNSMLISTSTIIYSGDDTDHNEEVYCEAGNVFDSRTFTTDKKKLYIIVPVTKVTLVKPLISESVTVISGNDTNFTCETGKSRPSGLLHWYVNGLNVTDQAILKVIQNGTKFIARSTLTYLGRIRDHNHDVFCKAFDIYNYGKNVSDKTTLNVLSSPTAEGNQSLYENIFVGTNEEIELTVVVLANPTPEANWTFTNKTGHDYDISGTYSNVSSLNTFRHVIRYKKENPQQSDYGNYTIQASNDVGTKFVHTFVVQPARLAQDHDSPLAMIGGVAGSFCAIVIVAVLAVVFFQRRHKQKKGDDKQHLRRDKGSNAKDDEEDEDGLKNNPLYITTDMSAREIGVYTQDNKHMRKTKDPSFMSNKNEKSKKQPKGLQKKEIELDVYENSEDIKKVLDKSIYGNVDNDNGFQIRRNKDGLIYADLDFALPESGEKCVIIGSENRTNYAMIDLTKKADPLPNDSDEEVEKEME